MNQRLVEGVSIGIGGLALLAGLACTRKEEGCHPSPSTAAPAAPSPARDEAKSRTAVTGGSDTPGKAAASPAVQRLIIRNAELYLKVDRVRPAAEAIQAQSKELGGFRGPSVHLGRRDLRPGQRHGGVRPKNSDEAVKDFRDSRKSPDKGSPERMSRTSMWTSDSQLKIWKQPARGIWSSSRGDPTPARLWR